MNKIIICPNCYELVMITDISCGIFRHGVVVETGEQVHPHSSKELCEEWLREGKIHGCGKPFKVTVLENGKLDVEKCEYI